MKRTFIETSGNLIVQIDRAVSTSLYAASEGARRYHAFGWAVKTQRRRQSNAIATPALPSLRKTKKTYSRSTTKTTRKVNHEPFCSSCGAIASRRQTAWLFLPIRKISSLAHRPFFFERPPCLTTIAFSASHTKQRLKIFYTQLKQVALVVI